LQKKKRARMEPQNLLQENVDDILSSLSVDIFVGVLLKLEQEATISLAELVDYIKTAFDVDGSTSALK